MNSKAQASSTFQLLISAIVAIAILTILMQVLGIIPGLFPTGDPAEKAKNLIVKAYNNPATQVSEKVTFAKKTTLLASGIAEGSGIGIEASQICFLSGDFEGSNTFTVEPQKIVYKGTTSKDVKLVAVCDDKTHIETTVNTDLELGSTADCTDFPENERVCVLVLKRTG